MLVILPMLTCKLPQMITYREKNRTMNHVLKASINKGNDRRWLQRRAEGTSNQLSHDSKKWGLLNMDEELIVWNWE